jgi:hypothetical protein
MISLPNRISLMLNESDVRGKDKLLTANEIYLLMKQYFLLHPLN